MSKLTEAKVRLDWARKVLTSDNLIIITDTEGLMRIGIDPGDIGDIISVAQYRASLVDFKDNVRQTIKGLDELVGDVAAERRKNTKKPGKKIPVTKV